MKKILSTFAIFILLLQYAYADLTIQITKGVNKPYPIAVVPFGHDVMLASSLPNGISGVITSDLTNSGRFSSLAVNQMPALPSDVSAFNWQQWNGANTGVEYAVVGNVTNGSAPATYTVTFELLSLLSNQPLLGQKYSNVPAAELRLLAHQISDSIYQNITGKRGYFRTKLAYVEVLNQGSPKAISELIVSDYDGFNPHVLLRQKNNPILSPAWSPNGTQLAYMSYVNNRQAIFIITLATGERRIIANFAGMNSAPAWSPDGKYIAMALSGSDTSDNVNIYTIKLSSREMKRYTDYGINTSPNWAPDQSAIVYNSDRGGSPQIYLMSLDKNSSATGNSRLSYTGLSNYDPVYTPDGKNLIIMTQQTRNGPIRLATLNIASNAMTLITNGRLDKSPSVAPTGDMVVYANYDNAHGILAETSLDGTVQIKLPTTRGTVESPAWSPFLN